MSNKHLNPAVKHDVVLLFDATNSNPNGDPDFGNQPRTDAETGHGLVTDVSIKRKIRDTLPAAVEHLGLNPDDFNIFIAAGDPLNTKIEKTAIDAIGALSDDKMSAEQRETVRKALAKKFIDLRLFGGVLSTGKTKLLGQIHGPLQVCFGRSIDAIATIENTITRVVATKEEDRDKATEMGNKWTVPYGLYRVNLHYSGSLGARTGVTTDDLKALYVAIENMLEHTRSAARPDMNVRGLYVYSHSDAFGSAPAHELQDLITVVKAVDGPPRAFIDYSVSVNEGGVPEAVTLTRLVG
jgi:CRISPR-associated protein Csd2